MESQKITHMDQNIEFVPATALPTQYTMKKTFFYTSFPTKEQEEIRKKTGWPERVPRELIEIRDIYPAPVIDPLNPWTIKKTLTQQEVDSGYVVVSFTDTFEHVIRYWSLEMARYLTDCGLRVGVTVWDQTEDKSPNKYNQYLVMMADDDYALTFAELMRTRNLKAGDEVHLYWDSQENCFKFRVRV